MPTIDFSNPAYKMAPVLPPAQGNSATGESQQIDFAKYETGANAPTTNQPALPPAQPTGPGFTQKVKTDFNTRVNAGADVINSKDNLPSKALQDVGQGAGFVGDITGALLGSVGNKIPVTTSPDTANPTLPALKSADGSSPTNLTQAFTAMMQSLGKTAPAGYVEQKVQEFSQKHPEAAGDLGAIINIASIIPEGEAAKVGAEGAAGVGKGVVEGIANAPKAVEDAKIAASGSSRIPTLDTAASRVKTQSVEDASSALPMKQGIGKSSIEDPAALHSKYYAQEKKALSDTKQDTALGMVGSDLGKSFSKVIKLRQNVGKTMASELEKFGSKGISSSGIVSGFQKDLIDSGAKYDALKQEVANTSESKFTTTDTKLLEKYGQELSKLGKDPTAKELDAFVGRMPNEIKALKSQAGVNFKTNAERIINKNLDSVRSTLTSAGTKEYKTARSSYSDLSNFVNEGIPFLGKKTSTGDFAKDASLVKSSVQSTLNGGKKDWLLKLEKLTGDPIIDKATLALQAMKDAGDYRGESLLNLIAEGNKVPTSVHGLADKIAGAAVKGARRVALGSPYEQTQRFLKSLKMK